jgi:hypothetical protein
MNADSDRTWIPFPDPIQESEINLELMWSAYERTTRAIERQAQLMGMTAKEYLSQALAAVITGNEEATVVTRNGRLA